MATRVIPEKRIFICDVCGKKDPRRVLNATFTISRHALDYQGSPCADGTHSFEACDDCHNKIVEAINQEKSDIKHAIEGEIGK